MFFVWDPASAWNAAGCQLCSSTVAPGWSYHPSPESFPLRCLAFAPHALRAQKQRSMNAKPSLTRAKSANVGSEMQ